MRPSVIGKKLTPALAENLRRRRKGKVGRSWYVDETYIRVRGGWRYLYRAIDRAGALVDVMLSELGGIPSPGRAGALPASARSRLVKAPGEVFGPKSRPFRRKVIAASRTLTLSNSTPNRSRRHEITAFAYAPTAWAGRRRSA